MVRGRIAGAPTPDMYRGRGGFVASRRRGGAVGSRGPNPGHMAAVRSPHPYGPALLFRGRIAGAPTPDMFRGRVAGAPTPDIWWGPGGRRLQACRGALQFLRPLRARSTGPVGPVNGLGASHGGSPIPPTGPPYRIRARATGRGRTSPPGVAHPQGVRGLFVASPPGVCSAFRGYAILGVRGSLVWRAVGDFRGPGFAGPYNSAWGLTGIWGPFTGPPYSLRARATGRGRIAGAPTPDIWRGRRASPPGAGPYNSPWGAHVQRRFVASRRMVHPKPLWGPPVMVPAHSE
eukprot:gene7597-biopygen3069